MLSLALISVFDWKTTETIHYSSVSIQLPKDANENNNVKLFLRTPNSHDNREQGQTRLRIALPEPYAKKLLHLDAPVSGVPKVLSVENTDGEFSIKLSDDSGIRTFHIEFQSASN